MNISPITKAYIIADLKKALRPELDLYLQSWDGTLGGRDAEMEEARRRSLVQGLAHAIMEGER